MVSIPLWCDCDASLSLYILKEVPVSIPLWCDCDQRVFLPHRPGENRFNPTMVRLRPAYPCTNRGPKRWFQSHYGAIATNVDDTYPHLVVVFQSHYGAIATNDTGSYLGKNPGVSIPLWCDCDKQRFPPGRESQTVSIPLWCDCDAEAKVKETKEALVSIPLWCDCD